MADFIGADSGDTSSSPYGAAVYVNGSGTWQGQVSKAFVYILFIILPLISLGLWRQRHIFPLNSTPSFLLIATQIGATFYILSLFQSMIAPSMPCGLHIIISWAEIFPYLPGSLLQLWYQWFVFQVQQSKCRGKRDFFVRHANLTSQSFLIKVFAGFGVVTCILPVIQLASRSADVLASPMTSAECLAYTSEGEKIVSSMLWYPLLIANVCFAFLMRSVKDAFNLGENWMKIIFFLSIGTPPKAVASVANGLQDEVKVNCYFMGQLAFAVSTVSYIWFASIVPLGMTLNNQKKKASAAVSHNMSSRSSKRHSINDFRQVTTTAELRRLLQSKELMAALKAYLVKEFCVENILYLESLDRLRAAGRVDSIARLSPSQPPQASKAQLLQELVADFIKVGAPYEVNIQADLRKRVLEAAEHLAKASTEQGVDATMKEQLYEEAFACLVKAEDEVLKMILNPYNRFAMAGGAMGYGTLNRLTMGATKDGDDDKAASQPGILDSLKSAVHPSVQ